jgi:prevent-host-death family protein
MKTNLDQLADQTLLLVKIGQRTAIMPKTVSLYDAKTTLSALVEQAAAGEEVIIAKNGRPMARLVPYGARAEARTPGLLKGQIRIADDFDGPLPDEIARAFRGESP